MRRKIIVAGTCQIAGIAAAFHYLFPDDEIGTQPFNPDTFRGDRESMLRDLGGADIVFGSGKVLELLAAEGRMPRRSIRMPGIVFSAFHPDIVCAQGTRVARRFPTNSAIVAWSYGKGLDPADAVRLFNRETFTALGYFRRWSTSVAGMKQAFDDAGMDFNRFYLSVKRDGAFMHTVNHPKAAALVHLAKMLAIEAGADASAWRKDFHIIDGLGRIESWPVYPELAYELGLQGSDCWLVDRGQTIVGLRNYVEYAYRKYAAADVQPGHLSILAPNPERYDAVLVPALEALR